MLSRRKIVYLLFSKFVYVSLHYPFFNFRVDLCCIVFCFLLFSRDCPFYLPYFVLADFYFHFKAFLTLIYNVYLDLSVYMCATGLFVNIIVNLNRSIRLKQPTWREKLQNSSFDTNSYGVWVRSQPRKLIITA